MTVYCHRCRKVTEWRVMRGGKREECVGCGDVFPCRKPCGHIDCLDTGEPCDAVRDDELETGTRPQRS